jgi:HKD family nuclease
VFAYELAVQSDANEGAVLAALRRAAAADSFERLRAAFAYASAGGAKLAADTLAEVAADWRSIEKRWLVSFDWGHTDPEALELLASLEASEVRVPYAQAVLARNLTPATCFHPKTAIFDRTGPNRLPTSLFVGSANLTVSGLETGHEHAAVGIWRTGRLSNDARDQLAGLRQQIAHLDDVWGQATPISPRLLRDYATRRRRRQPASEDRSLKAQRVSRDTRGAARRFELPLDVAAVVAAADALWIEIHYVVPNRGPHRPGNQIDTQRGTRVFFGFSNLPVPRNTILGGVTILYGNNRTTHHIRYHNNYMDRLSLPIPGEEGPSAYLGTTLLFERQLDGSFRMTVGTSAQVRSWKARSQRQATRFVMQRGREWGVFS